MEEKIYCAIIDGDYLSRLLIKRIIERKTKAFTFLEASDGIEAVSLIKNNIIDICFINPKLGEIDGFDVSKLLRQKNRKVDIIALNSSMDNNIIENNPQFNYCLNLPIDTKTITDLLFKIILN